MRVRELIDCLEKIEDYGEIYKEKYDKLVLSPGAKPINPFENLKSDRIQTLRTINDSIKIKENECIFKKIS